MKFVNRSTGHEIKSRSKMINNCLIKLWQKNCGWAQIVWGHSGIFLRTILTPSRTMLTIYDPFLPPILTIFTTFDHLDHFWPSWPLLTILTTFDHLDHFWPFLPFFTNNFYNFDQSSRGPFEARIAALQGNFKVLPPLLIVII